MLMKIENIIVRNVFKVSPSEKISKILFEMSNKRIHQVPIVDGEIFLGMVFLKDIVMEDIDPSSATAKSFMRKDVPRLSALTTETEAATSMLRNGFRALPVMNGEKLIGIISETDLLDFIKESTTAEQIMTEPFSIREGDSLGKAKQTMREHNISRLPITNERGELVGTIDTIDLAKTIKPQEKQTLSKSKAGAGETTQMTGIAVSNLMRTPVTIDRNSDIRKVIETLKSNEEAIVIDGRKPVGIISPKDVIELMISVINKFPIQISGIDHDDEISKKSIYDPLEKWIKKSATKVDYIFVYVNKHKSNGRVKYSLHMRMRTKFGFFVLKSDGWDLLTCSQELARKAESMTEKRHGIMIDRKKKRGKFTYR